MKRFYFKGLLMMFVFAVALAFSGSCCAAVSFQADGGKNFAIDFNHKNEFGKYVLLDMDLRRAIFLTSTAITAIISAKMAKPVSTRASARPSTLFWREMATLAEYNRGC